MNETLSRIVTDLFVKSKKGGELSTKIDRLRGELKKIIEHEDAIFGKFRGLLESFEEIIPEESQRYNAAMKALSTTSKLSKEEIVKAVNKQLEEFKILEKGLMPALPDWRSELKDMEASSREMKDEISKLREQIAQLESEEEEIRKDMAVREREVKHVEKTLKELFAEIEDEITDIKEKVEEFTAENAAAPAPRNVEKAAPKGAAVQSAPQKTEKPAAEKAAAQPVPHKEPVKKDIPAEKAEDVQEIETPEPVEHQLGEGQKKCPMCGGIMNFHAAGNMWMCYSCAYEESINGEARGEQGEHGESGSAPGSTPSSGPGAGQSTDYSGYLDEDRAPVEDPSWSDNPPSEKSKACPVCREVMYWYPKEKAWRCPSCQYERRI